jgi:hypothetical protein
MFNHLMQLIARFHDLFSFHGCETAVSDFLKKNKYYKILLSVELSNCS